MKKAVQTGKIVAATWNTEWRDPGSRDGDAICERLALHSPDIICLTEVCIGLADRWAGYTIEGANDWNGRANVNRRKVQLWSRRPWHDVNIIGSPDLPKGMFVQGSTDTELGRVTVAGIVIPFHLANVTSGRRDKRMWQEHRQYLDALPSVIGNLPGMSVVMGDFNQRIPSTWVPQAHQARLKSAFLPMTIATTGLRGPDNSLSIDHIAFGRSMKLDSAEVISNRLECSREISDHFGVVATFR